MPEFASGRQRQGSARSHQWWEEKIDEIIVLCRARDEEFEEAETIVEESGVNSEPDDTSSEEVKPTVESDETSPEPEETGTDQGPNVGMLGGTLEFSMFLSGVETCLGMVSDLWAAVYKKETALCVATVASSCMTRYLTSYINEAQLLVPEWFEQEDKTPSPYPGLNSLFLSDLARFNGFAARLRDLDQLEELKQIDVILGVANNFVQNAANLEAFCNTYARYLYWKGTRPTTIPQLKESLRTWVIGEKSPAAQSSRDSRRECTEFFTIDIVRNSFEKGTKVGTLQAPSDEWWQELQGKTHLDTTRPNITDVHLALLGRRPVPVYAALQSAARQLMALDHVKQRTQVLAALATVPIDGALFHELTNIPTAGSW
ncbi:Uu.00g141830.m01.CDS01 [Anthostomella pinea]|uniref:Uu.00g141830.m01.CDS01 n=1 Tax=Anthostomella pinea TaxID=933095 RepID=A0AAI8VQD2_9PEZI|nr:Uu.00g141830.m01.CDS01 [Anthostomella pinea]